MISYAQNREDVILARVFREPGGFYIDVGAGHPQVHSVTKWFYDRGWSGVNVEPQPDFFHLLATARPRDVNLNVAVSDRTGSGTLYEVAASIGCSTLQEGLARDIEAGGAGVTRRPVRTLTLDRICQEHAGRPIDFLKIDVEGHEREALLGANLAAWRPRVVVVEATRPGTPDPSHGAWEPIVLAQGYAFAAFDGLNRYYVRHEDEALIPALGRPVSVFDEYTPWEHAQAAAEVDRLGKALEAARGEARSVREEVETLRGEARSVREEVEAVRAALADRGRRADRLAAELTAARAELARARATTVPRSTHESALVILAMTRQHLEMVRANALAGA